MCLPEVRSGIDQARHLLQEMRAVGKPIASVFYSLHSPKLRCDFVIAVVNLHEGQIRDVVVHHPSYMKSCCQDCFADCHCCCFDLSLICVFAIVHFEPDCHRHDYGANVDDYCDGGRGSTYCWPDYHGLGGISGDCHDGVGDDDHLGPDCHRHGHGVNVGDDCDGACDSDRC